MLRMTLTMMRMRRPPRWSQGWWHWHACDIGGHRDIEDDDNDDMVRCLRCLVMKTAGGWQCTVGNVPDVWWLSEVITITRSISALSLPGLPTILQVTKWPSVVTSRLPKKTDDWEIIYKFFWKRFSLWLSSGFGLNPWKRTGKRMWK